MRNLFRHKSIVIKSFILIILSSLLLGRAFNGIEPYATGDGPEYVLMTEALYNHLTPEIRESDAISFKESYTKIKPWEENYKFPVFDDNQAFFKKKDVKAMDYFNGFYVDKSNKKYSYHFFFYSLINVPARFITDLMDLNPLASFQGTNAFLIIITTFIFLFFSPFETLKTILFSLIFVFSSVYWYLGWTHPEVYTVCLISLGFWSFFQNKLYIALLLVSFAALQNQPILILMVFIVIKILFRDKIKLKTLLHLALFGGIYLWPSLFYLAHFGTPNIIKDAGFLDSQFITFTRVFGFFFDINQGVILVIPLILFIYISLIIRKLIFTIRKKEMFDYNILFPLFIIISVCIVSMMVNWNHGQAIVNRYATWVSAIIIIQTVFLVNNLKAIINTTLFHYMFFTQVVSILYHQQFNQYDWGQNRNLPLASYILDYHPSLYNPDPQIFIVRTSRHYDVTPNASPVFYLRNNNTLTKMIVHKDQIDSLFRYGFSKEEINRIKPKLKFINNWAYLNKGEFKTSMTGPEILEVIKLKKLEIIKSKILNSSVWMNQIKEKALQRGISEQEMLNIDALYMLDLELKENTK